MIIIVISSSRVLNENTRETLNRTVKNNYYKLYHYHLFKRKIQIKRMT